MSAVPQKVSWLQPHGDGVEDDVQRDEGPEWRYTDGFARLEDTVARPSCRSARHRPRARSVKGQNSGRLTFQRGRQGSERQDRRVRDRGRRRCSEDRLPRTEATFEKCSDFMAFPPTPSPFELGQFRLPSLKGAKGVENVTIRFLPHLGEISPDAGLCRLLVSARNPDGQD